MCYNLKQACVGAELPLLLDWPTPCFLYKQLCSKSWKKGHKLSVPWAMWMLARQGSNNCFRFAVSDWFEPFLQKLGRKLFLRSCFWWRDPYSCATPHSYCAPITNRKQPTPLSLCDLLKEPPLQPPPERAKLNCSSKHLSYKHLSVMRNGTVTFLPGVTDLWEKLTVPTISFTYRCWREQDKHRFRFLRPKIQPRPCSYLHSL